MAHNEILDRQATASDHASVDCIYCNNTIIRMCSEFLKEQLANFSSQAEKSIIRANQQRDGQRQQFTEHGDGGVSFRSAERNCSKLLRSVPNTT